MVQSTAISPARPRLEGYLNCVCERSDTGRCNLTKKDYRVPIHISKPYWDGDTLLLNVMSPTAGMLDGDKVSLDIQVQENAALAISNPTSLRIHKMPSDGEAVWNQYFTVGRDAFLECNPEWLMPQAESSFTQTTDIQIADGGELFFIEALAPGRVAHGESFAFRSFKNRLALRYDGELAACEKHAIEPARNTHRGWRNERLENPFYVSIFLASKRLLETKAFFDSIYQMRSDALSIGASRLASGPCWNVKALSDDPTLLRSAIGTIRRHFYESIGRSAPNLRR